MYWDPTGHSAANVTVGNVTVANAQCNNGTTTGNLRDIVAGLGGTVTSTQKSGVYQINMPNGATATVDTNKGLINDSNGKISAFKIVDNRSQVSVRQMANLAGVEDTISWWSDDKKQTNVVVQPEMHNAPVQVTREGDKVTINAYVDFTGDADKIFPGTEKSYILPQGAPTPPSGSTYAEVAAQAIENKWSGYYSVYGSNLNVTTNIYSNNYSPNGILETFDNDEQNTLEYKIIAGENILTKNKMRSYESLETGPLMNGILQVAIKGDYNGEDVLKWSINTSSPKITIFDSDEDGFFGRDWFETTVAHEFGHALGLGDAYNAGYRGGTWFGSTDGCWAPSKYNDIDQYGRSWNVSVPNNDIMLEGTRICKTSDNDIRMVLEAYKTGKPQMFPLGSKNKSLR